jgi:DNA-binding response OmpR family regulator
MSKISPLIYVADDDPAILDLVVIVLAKNGFEVVGFPDAEALVAALVLRAPAAVLLDVRMPGQSGLDALKAIKDLPGGGDIPVLMLTGDGRLDRIVQAMQLGAAGYLMKPFEAAQLVERVWGLLAG